MTVDEVVSLEAIVVENCGELVEEVITGIYKMVHVRRFILH